MFRIKNKKLLLFLPSALVLLVYLVFAAPDSAHAAWNTIEPLYKVLKTNQNIKIVWQNVRNMVNVIVIAALIFIAFANILRINLNNYAIKKFLPALIAGVILANFSYFICQVCIDLSNVAMSLLMNGATGSAAGHVGVGKVGVAGAFDFSNHDIDVHFMPREFLYVIFEIIGAVIVFILSILFFVRNYIIYFLVALSPLAMMATVLPETKSVYKQWSSHFFKWTFMPLLSLFWLWLGGMWWSSGFDPGGSGTPPVPGTEFNSTLMGVAFAGFCYYLALTSPWKMGGEIMGKWGGLVKNAWNKTGGAAWKSTGGAAIGAGKNWVNDKYKNVKNTTKDWAKSNLWGVRDINRRIEKGRMQQKLIDNAVTKNAFLREQQALVDVMRAGRYKGKPALESRVKAMQREYFVGDEYERETYTGKTNRQLMDQGTFIQDGTNPDGTARLRFASNEEIFKGKKHIVVKDAAGNVTEDRWENTDFKDWHGEAKTFKNDKERIEAASKNGATAKELQLRQKGSRNSDDATDPIGFTPEELIQRFGGKVDVRTMASTDVTEREFAVSEVAAARAVARGGSIGDHPEVKLAQESVSDLAEAIRAEKQGLKDYADRHVAVAGSVMDSLSIAANRAGGGDDGVDAARSRLNEIVASASAGEKLLADSDPNTKSAAITEALKHAQAISGNFDLSLTPHAGNNAKMEEELQHIFSSTQKAIEQIGPNLGQELNKYQQHLQNNDLKGWREQKVSSETQNLDLHAELQALNKSFAERLPSMEGQTFDDLRKSLGDHVDAIVQSNEDVQAALRSNPGNVDISSIKTEVTNTVNSAIGKQMSSSNGSTAGDPTARIREGMVKALTDVNVNKSLARTFQKASEGALKTVKPSTTVVHDVKPPVNADTSQ